MKKCKIALVGTGMIGGGLAVNALMQGHPVTLYDVIPAEAVQKNIRNILSIMVSAGALTEEGAEEALSRATFTGDLAEAVTGAAFVQECVPERIELKRDTYRRVQEINPGAVIASSTSSLFPSQHQEGAIAPENSLVGHPYNPSYLLPLIEVCGGKDTCEEAIETAMQLYESIGKVPVRCRKEVKGFVVNKLSWGALAAAREAVAEGICSVEDMDKAIMYGPGLRMAVTGQLLTMSLGVQGGFREYAKKFGGASDPELYGLLAQGVEAEIASRPAEIGNTEESVIVYRDRMFASILKLQNLL